MDFLRPEHFFFCHFQRAPVCRKHFFYKKRKRRKQDEKRRYEERKQIPSVISPCKPHVGVWFPTVNPICRKTRLSLGKLHPLSLISLFLSLTHRTHHTLPNPPFLPFGKGHHPFPIPVSCFFKLILETTATECTVSH